MNRRNTECILDQNPRHRFPVVDGKLRMHALCQRIGVPTPEIFGAISAHSQLRRLPVILSGHHDFVLKPNRGAAGRGILVVVDRQHDAFVRHQGQRLAWGDIHQHVSSIVSGLYSLGGQPDTAVIQERVRPDRTLERLCFQGIGDVRVLLYRHVPVMAMLRLPTRLSGGRANLHQGGLGVGIHLSTGMTTHAVLRNRAAQHHPDTGESVIGVTVPHWNEILRMARRVSQEVGLGYLGVDIVIDTRRGPLLLEANARPGLAIQIANHQGLLPRLAEVDRRLAHSEHLWPDAAPDR